MKHENIRKGMIALLLLVFIGSGAGMARLRVDTRQAAQVIEEAAQLALPETVTELPEETPPAADVPTPAPEKEEAAQLPRAVEELMSTDLEALRQVNPDVLGWFHIPDSGMSFPLMRSRDNSDYLTRAWDGSESRSGSLFLECQNDPALTDFHTLLYGHNLEDGQIFSELVSYKDQSYFDSHPCVYIVTDDRILAYRVFSAYTAHVVSDTYRLYFEDDARRQSAIDFWLASSEMECDVVPDPEDAVLTLSTCTGNGDAAQGIRWVVHGVLEREYERK